MEVELMKANNRRDTDWPMSCICNLCSCGSHSCASFALNDSKYENNNNNNRCQGSSSIKAMMEQEIETGNTGPDGCAGCRFESGERYLAASGKRLPQAGDVRVKRRTEQDAADREQRKANELIHVLVTRPEIASKPRDNIVFEGDMDLRTTFETSYEALAKMRLDQWKKYQEATRSQSGASDHRKSASNQIPARRSHPTMSPIVASNNAEQDDEREKEKEKEKEEVEEEQTGVSRPKTEPAALVVDNDIILDRQAKQHERNMRGAERAAQMAPRSRTPFALADTNSQNIHDATDWDYHYNLNQSSRPQVSQQQRHLHDQRFISESPQMQRRQQQAMTTRTPEASSTGETQHKVDPDLAPIIVYDANMNRLERVGLRKRSKYRPSTSLRSGARGLFGDQKPDEEHRDEISHSGRVSRGEDKAMQTDDALANKSGQAMEPDSGSGSGNNTTRGQPVAASRGSISLRMRNLKNSPLAPDRLVYSERNVPVNSKRRVDDNVNMRDHVREQNIVDGGRYEPPQPKQNTQSRPEDNEANENGCCLEPDNGDDLVGDEFRLERDLADIRLAEQEEADANAEIQRVAALDLAPIQPRSSALMNQQHQSSINSRAAGIGGGSETRTSSRQSSRLQRTCQEQSFHIGQNSYPVIAEPSRKSSPTFGAKFKSPAMNSTHASPQSRVYSNLFSESPDFILTTGKPFMMANTTDDDGNNNQRSSRDDKKQRSTTAFATSAADANDANDEQSPGEMFATTNNMTDELAAVVQDQYQTISGDQHARDRHECRVVKLDERFDYVGSRSGHKYFVEKILESS